jgi:hypothetical protein
MTKTSHHSPRCLEVTVMFEPHRLQHDLLQRAYALLVPVPRRRPTTTQPSATASPVQPPQSGERSVS